MYREKVGAEGYSKAPVGAGPYRITRREWQFPRSSSSGSMGYYAGAPKPKPAIKNLKIIEVLDAASELSAFIAGQTDWIWNYNPDQFDNPQDVAGQECGARRAPCGSTTYSSTPPGGAARTIRSPTSRCARRFSTPIDRTAISHNLMQGDSHPVNAPCFPTQFGCDQAAAVEYDYNPAKAKALLKEAGFPDGFTTTLYTYVLPVLFRRRAGLFAGGGHQL